MIHVKPNIELFGLEKKLSLIQSSLDVSLSRVWNDVHIYGLTERVQEKGDQGFWPRIFKFKKDYRPDIFLDDRINGSIAFLETSREAHPRPLATLDCLFTLRGDKIYDSDDYRGIEKAKSQAKEALRRCNKITLTGNIKTGISEVFSGFRINDKKYRDMAPWYVFSFEFQTSFLEKTCTLYD